MNAIGQHIQGLADELEKHICDQLGKSRPAGVLRRMKVNQLVNNVNKSGEVRAHFAFNSLPQNLDPSSLRAETTYFPF